MSCTSHSLQSPQRHPMQGEGPMASGPLSVSSTAFSRCVSTMPTKPVPAAAGRFDNELSLSALQTRAHRACSRFRDKSTLLSSLCCQEIERGGKEGEHCVRHTCHYACHLNPGILREPSSHPSASASCWGNVSMPGRDVRGGRIQMSNRDPKRMLKGYNSEPQRFQKGC